MAHKYRWESPYGWLMDKAEGYADINNSTELYHLVEALAGRLDSDDIQDLFQAEMSEDGYFKKESEVTER